MCHTPWLQVRVLINAWGMYTISNLAEGTPTTELLPLQKDSKEKKQGVCW